MREGIVDYRQSHPFVTKRRIKTMMKKLLFVIASIALAATSFSADWYVCAATGKKKGPGTKEEPFKAIADALKKAAPGDTIYMAEGNYSGLLGASEIVIDKPVTIKGGYAPDFSSRDIATHTTKIQPPNDKNDSKGIGVITLKLVEKSKIVCKLCVKG